MKVPDFCKFKDRNSCLYCGRNIQPDLSDGGCLCELTGMVHNAAADVVEVGDVEYIKANTVFDILNHYENHDIVHTIEDHMSEPLRVFRQDGRKKYRKYKYHA